jgi:hypothetical protein
MKFEHTIIVDTKEKKETKLNKKTSKSTHCPQCELNELKKKSVVMPVKIETYKNRKYDTIEWDYRFEPK